MYAEIRHSAGYCDIPRKGLATAPWNKSATIWPFTISVNQTRWFFSGRDSCSRRAGKTVVTCLSSARSGVKNTDYTHYIGAFHSVRSKCQIRIMVTEKARDIVSGAGPQQLRLHSQTQAYCKLVSKITYNTLLHPMYHCSR